MKHPLRWAAVAAALGLAAAAGFTLYSQPRLQAAPAQSTQLIEADADPLTQFRTEREQLREKQRAQLSDIIHSDATDAATLALAQRQLMQLMSDENAEVTLEGLLDARGFGDVLVSANGGAVYVMTRRESLTRQETAVILDLVLHETGVTAGNVKILPGVAGNP